MHFFYFYKFFRIIVEFESDLNVENNGTEAEIETPEAIAGKIIAEQIVVADNTESNGGVANFQYFLHKNGTQYAISNKGANENDSGTNDTKSISSLRNTPGAIGRCSI